jgi:hypothetical protein
VCACVPACGGGGFGVLNFTDALSKDQGVALQNADMKEVIIHSSRKRTQVDFDRQIQGRRFTSLQALIFTADLLKYAL